MRTIKKLLRLLVEFVAGTAVMWLPILMIILLGLLGITE